MTKSIAAILLVLGLLRLATPARAVTSSNVPSPRLR